MFIKIYVSSSVISRNDGFDLVNILLKELIKDGNNSQVVRKMGK